MKMIHFLCKIQTRKLPSGEDVITAQSLSFYPVTRHHSGVYFCNADNGFGPNPVKAEIKLDVQRKSHVEEPEPILALSSVTYKYLATETYLLPFRCSHRGSGTDFHPHARG